jgi:hypothetical protein
LVVRNRIPCVATRDGRSIIVQKVEKQGGRTYAVILESSQKNYSIIMSIVFGGPKLEFCLLETMALC